MFIIGIILFLALLTGIAFLSGSPLIFVDLPSLLIILILSLSVLLISGLFKDFLKGFKLISHKENMYSTIELKKICEALRLAIRTILLSGILGALAGAVGLLWNTSDASAMPLNIGVAMLTLLYALIFTLILLPVLAKAKAVLATLE